MRNRAQTLESLKRLADRPGTVEEGRTAKRLLERMKVHAPACRPFNLTVFPRGAKAYYNYWAYSTNEPCTVACDQYRTVEGRIWMRLKFDSLKSPRWVPVTSAKGCHLSIAPLSARDSDYLYHLY